MYKRLLRSLQSYPGIMSLVSHIVISCTVKKFFSSRRRLHSENFIQRVVSRRTEGPDLETSNGIPLVPLDQKYSGTNSSPHWTDPSPIFGYLCSVNCLILTVKHFFSGSGLVLLCVYSSKNCLDPLPSSCLSDPAKSPSLPDLCSEKTLSDLCCVRRVCGPDHLFSRLTLVSTFSHSLVFSLSQTDKDRPVSRRESLDSVEVFRGE